MRRYKDITIFAGILVAVIGLTTIAEQLTLTSYYPSPYGSYRQLRTSQGANFATTSGNVGIGTTSPQGKLHITSGSGPELTFENAAEITAKNSSGDNDYFLWPRWSDNITYLNFGSGGFNIRNNASTSRIFIQNNGNVGIGSTSPGSRLDVTGSITTSGLVQSVGYYFGDTQTSALNWKLYSPTAGIAALRYLGDAKDAVRFGKRADGGNVSWGVQLPQGSGFGGSGIMFDTLDAGGQAEANTKPYIWALSPKMIFNVPTGGSYQWKINGAITMTLSSNGNLGVGVTTPNYRLQLPSTANNAGRGFANQWIDASSKRYKKDIVSLSSKDYEQTLKKIEKTNLVYFRYKDQKDKRRYLGVIAEEAPEEIVTSDREGLHLGGLGAFNTAGIKALNEKIKTLQKALGRKEDENETLKLRLEKIEKSLSEK